MHKGTSASPLGHLLSCQHGAENHSRTSFVPSQTEKRSLFLQLQHCHGPWKELRVWHSLIPPPGSLSVSLFFHPTDPSLALPCSVCSLPRWFDLASLGPIPMERTDVGRGEVWDPKAHRTAGFSLCSGQILTGAGFSSLLLSWMLQHGTQAVKNQSNYSPRSKSPHFPPPAIDFGNTA